MKLKDQIKVDLKLERDLHITMRNAVRDLISAGQFPAPESSLPSLRPQKHRLIDDERYLKKLSAILLRRNSARRKAGLQKQARKLPINTARKRVVDMVQNNTYSILVAETGTGKSTQLPQLLLDNAIGEGVGAWCKVICVQPRRIAAMSLAQHVAQERGEPLGQSIGYQIRFNVKIGKEKGSVTYCTTGVLLNQLQTSHSFLNSVTHILLDEVHERHIDLDLLMLFLRRIIHERQEQGLPTPKVVVMSATLSVDLFASYFSNKTSSGDYLPAPHIHIPGRTFLVERYYLDDFLTSLVSVYPPQKVAPLLNDPDTAEYLRHHSSLLKPELSGPEEATQSIEETEEDIASENSENPTPINDDSSKALVFPEEDPLVPITLICLSVGYVLSTTDEGAILVFLPGLGHLMDVERALHLNGSMLGFDFSNTDRFRILLLHSGIPEGQADLFGQVQPGCRRIILATNIAETSITIPDVKYVIDSGKSHQKLYDPRTRITRLACCWVSQSSVSQRSGRAGRLQNGEYFGLFPREMHDRFRIDISPAMHRTDLQATCLLAKRSISELRIQDLLRDSIEPPEDVQVQRAVQHLQTLQALDAEESLTTLGSILADLPLEPGYGKLVLLGIVFRCLDPLLIIGAMGSDMSLFHMTASPQARKELFDIRTQYSNDTWSDHMTAINAFQGAREELFTSGFGAAFRYALSNRIHFSRFREVLYVSRQILGFLSRSGFIPKQRTADDPEFRFGGAELNTNSWRTPLVKALFFHAMYPNLAAPVRSSIYRTEDGKDANLGNSVNSVLHPKCLLTYNLKYQPIPGQRPVLRNTSHITPLTACLFGGRLQGRGDIFFMDDWLQFTIKVSEEGDEGRYAARLLVEYRKALDKVGSPPFFFNFFFSLLNSNSSPGHHDFLQSSCKRPKPPTRRPNSYI